MSNFYKCATMSLVLSAFAMSSFAQSEPSKPTYEKRVYEKDGRTYVQKSLPVYLKFSVMPDGKEYPLKSEAHPKDANPMYLDTEGVNYIRSKWAVDPETGKAIVPQREVQMPLYADGLAPRTSLTFSGAPRYRSGGITYFGKGLSFALKSTDGVSGVMETKYALNGGYTDYSGNVAVSKEGAQTVYYYAADFVGNAESTRSKTFTLDLTAPQSSHAIVGIVYNNNILAPSTQFSLSTSDNLSGVKTVRYSFDGGSDRFYNPNIGMAGLQDGEHTLYYYAKDNVENTATKSSFAFYLDRLPPVVEHSVNGDQYKGNYLYVSPRTKIGLSATDNKAGVKKIFYRWDEKERFDYGSEFNIPNTLGLHTVKYDATDNVENLAPNKYLKVFLDNRNPETGIKYGRPQFFHRDTLFITSRTAISLFARDAHSGVLKTEYAIDGGGMKGYSQFMLPSEGYHTVTFKSTDRVNNVEEMKTSSVFVDNTPPDLYVNFSIEPIGQKGGLKIYPNYVRMYIGATDKHVGTDKLFYSIDGGALTPYSSAATLDVSEMSRFKKRKKYKVKVVGEDKLGNKSEKTFEFYVGRQD